ncbi:MAG: phosphatidate cytidylyltransferase, partial [Thermocrispum sp.]
MASETAGSAPGHAAEPDPERAAPENRVTTGDAAAAPSSRGGRNLPAAIAVGVLLGAAVLV